MIVLAKRNVRKRAFAIFGELIDDTVTTLMKFSLAKICFELAPMSPRFRGLIQQVGFGPFEMPKTGKVAVALVNGVFERPVQTRVWELRESVQLLIGEDDGIESHRRCCFGNASRIVVVVPAAIDQRLIDDVEACHGMPFPVGRPME